MELCQYHFLFFYVVCILYLLCPCFLIFSSINILKLYANKCYWPLQSIICFCFFYCNVMVMLFYVSWHLRWYNIDVSSLFSIVMQFGHFDILNDQELLVYYGTKTLEKSIVNWSWILGVFFPESWFYLQNHSLISSLVSVQQNRNRIGTNRIITIG